MVSNSKLKTQNLYLTYRKFSIFPHLISLYLTHFWFFIVIVFYY